MFIFSRDNRIYIYILYNYLLVLHFQVFFLLKKIYLKI